MLHFKVSSFIGLVDFNGTAKTKLAMLAFLYFVLSVGVKIGKSLLW